MTAIETGCPYVLSAGGMTAVFNNSNDPDFIGYANDVTGLDMYGIRENAQTKSAGDGGYHGPFWRDRRPFTISGFIFPTTPLSARAAAQDKLAGVVGEALRQDGTMLWTPLSDGIQRGVYFRTQQPFRSTKGQSNVERNILVAGVSRDWRIIAWAQKSAHTNYSTGWPVRVGATNIGNADAAPIFTITGPITNPIITNQNSGKTLTFNTPSVLNAGDTAIIDLTGVFPSVLLNGSDISYAIDPLNTDWTIALQKGVNTFLLNGSGSPTTATGLTVAWNDSWH